MTSPSFQLIELIDAFVTGRDRSLAQTSQMESLIVESFRDEAWATDALEALALYRPGGSDELIDENLLGPELLGVKAAIIESLGR